MTSKAINYQKWINQSLEQGFEGLEILIEENKGFELTLDKSQIDNTIYNDNTTVILRGIFNNKEASLFFEKIDDKTFRDALIKLKENCQTITTCEPAIIFEGSPSYPEVLENNFDFSQIPFQAKRQLLLKAEKQLKKSAYLQTANNIFYSENYYKKTLLNSKGINLTHQNSYASLYVAGVFQKDQDIESHGKSVLAKEFSAFDPIKQARQVVKEAEKQLGGKSLPSDKYQIVFSNKMFAYILANFSEIFSGNNAYRNLTKLKNKVKHLIASPKVNIIDDPLHKDAYFKEKFDEEGVACQTKAIVSQGVFKGFIHDLKTAHIFNQTPTGNSFGGSIAMVNCYLVPGTNSFEKMISKIELGVYITDLIGMHAGIKTFSGDFSLQASGFKIEKGKITTPVKMIVISGNFFEVLKNIEDIANDFEFLPSGFGSASVYVKELSVGGEK
ncbi:TldD/PmbA family protein [Candidatus Phytoplasma solani]|uniref:TldD/PmbA family protein n=1 Tax=Candidatus Phytoplasma solani TaxID=69896 RepID=UPI00358FF6F2